MAFTVDARGLRCPWPLVRLARALREGATEAVLLADDPQVARDIPALAAERGWVVAADAGRDPPRYRVTAPKRV